MIYYNIAKYILKPVLYLLYRVEVQGKENIPKNGPAIIFSNHVKALDPAMIAVFIDRPITYMAKEELFNVPFLGWYLKKAGMFPVKRKTGDVSAIKNSLKVLKEGRLFGIFPEGTRSKTGEIGDVQGGVAMIAIKGKSPVIPAVITKDYSIFKKVTIKIGKPIDLSEYYESRVDSEAFKKISQNIMENVKTLSKSFWDKED